VPSVSEWRWLYRQVRPFLAYEFGSIVLILAASALSLTSPLLMKWLIDSILPQHAWRDLILVAVLYFAVNIGGHGLRDGSLARRAIAGSRRARRNREAPWRDRA